MLPKIENTKGSLSHVIVSVKRVIHTLHIAPPDFTAMIKDMSELNLPSNPTLKDFQKYVQQMCEERGFNHETLAQIFVLFTEEVGEMARVVRKIDGMKTDVLAKKPDADEELADLFIYLLDMANVLDVDLELAFRKKEEKNKLRTWA